jgi:hypothetical protein
MAAGKYWALYQDHVASCAIRIAREAYAVTSIERAIVNVKIARASGTTTTTTTTMMMMTTPPPLRDRPQTRARRQRRGHPQRARSRRS